MGVDLQQALKCTEDVLGDCGDIVQKITAAGELNTDETATAGKVNTQDGGM